MLRKNANNSDCLLKAYTTNEKDKYKQPSEKVVKELLRRKRRKKLKIMNA